MSKVFRLCSSRDYSFTRQPLLAFQMIYTCRQPFCLFRLLINSATLRSLKDFYKPAQSSFEEVELRWEMAGRITGLRIINRGASFFKLKSILSTEILHNDRRIHHHNRIVLGLLSSTYSIHRSGRLAISLRETGSKQQTGLRRFVIKVNSFVSLFAYGRILLLSAH